MVTRFLKLQSAPVAQIVVHDYLGWGRGENTCFLMKNVVFSASVSGRINSRSGDLQAIMGAKKKIWRRIQCRETSLSV